MQLSVIPDLTTLHMMILISDNIQVFAVCWASAFSSFPQSYFNWNFYRPRSEASESYVFTGVCHSLHIWGGGEVWHQMHHGIGHRGEMEVWPGWGGGGGRCLVRGDDTSPCPPGSDLHPTPTTVNARAVRILLECILVEIFLQNEHSFLLQCSYNNSYSR